MKLYIANPIYDTVFKYLMEDERIARTILSALLKKDVIKVEQRPHEYANTSRNEVSMFRIDFGATIREKNGDEHVVLIELQKTWLETETLRFRQYLGTQYSRKENIVEDSADKHALPMIAVYLLGHRVDDIQVPVIYVNHKTYDYDGNEIVSEKHNAFVESLTHDSIIVQIPLLRGRVNNRLEKVLSVFDQSNATKSNPQTIEINEDVYAGDLEMEYILKRLLSAASNPDVRQNMNVEDEFFKAIEDRDTAIMLRDKKLEEKDKKLEEKDKKLEEKDKKLEEKDKKLEEKDKKLEEKEMLLDEQNKKLDEQNKILEEQNKKLEEQNHLLANAVKGMLSNGMDVKTIASMVGLTEDMVRSFQ